MSAGRSEKRIAKNVSLKVSVPPDPKPHERILTENVSAHGARVLLEQRLQPGQLVLIDSPADGVFLQARIVYCERISTGKFAVGLEITGRVEPWARPY
jgi:PilZ domain-containing protein